ncbi:DUF2269 family protein [Pseudomonas sp. CCI3.2]|uniref:DUF2269 family protein n=1 Tax=unclassified Pseudomonas TaxID=196821 RepID=UPI002AC908EC|nr:MULTISPECIES: DUF2269 family protein [unclassified Pseudomonas]MEB0076894.1 DUF2269 family protein [Pseudomonas sp. MH10out]MEB0091856.1 DUF2269 family protein [Pseudomonas sp. CCI4.2]MEB0102303.1 DUF2269 family protein [Pseudomonas sp. CCI3.2]MEB0119273.1 DUF2269 family protein [Pseudomonas sp. CCI1.2]MEB0129667.1 DUF2269 family protein [Pseudomonas sp. CCI2.4]
MEHFTAIKIVHVVATVLFLLSALGLVVWVIRGRRAGDLTTQRRTLQRPWLFAWILMALCLLTLPISGWWLVHYAGWPLGQTWLLAASVLYTLGTLSWAWLLVRLNRLRVPSVIGHPKFTLALALFCGVCFIAIAGLMGAKPV